MAAENPAEPFENHFNLGEAGEVHYSVDGGGREQFVEERVISDVAGDQACGGPNRVAVAARQSSSHFIISLQEEPDCGSADIARRR